MVVCSATHADFTERLLFGAETTVDCNLIFWKILLLGGILTLFPNVFDLAHVLTGVWTTTCPFFVASLGRVKITH